MNLMYLKEDAVLDLKTSLSSTHEHYRSSDINWIHERFENKNIVMPSRTTIDKVQLVIPESKLRHFDMDNIRIIHDSLKILHTHQATDERIWTYMTHFTYREYMLKRWPAGSVSLIRERYFVNTPTRGLVRNGISRLWWYGHLTYDSSFSDPYTLTETLMDEQDIALQLIDRTFSRNNAFLKNILRVLTDYKKTHGKKADRDDLRKLYVAINQIGGAQLLDFYDYNSIEKIVLSYIE